MVTRDRQEKKENRTNRSELVNTQGLSLSVIEISPTLSKQGAWPKPRWICAILAGLDDRSDARRTANRADAAYGMANSGNVSPRRRHVSGKHFELFFRGEPNHVANPDALKVSRRRLQPSGVKH